MEVNNTRKLYDALKSDGYTDLGDFSSFEGKLKDSGKREMLYDVLKKDGWQDLGDFSQFESKLGYAPINNENIKETDYVSQSSVNPPPISLRQEVDIPKSDQSEYVNPWDNSADYNFESLRKKGKIETATPPPPTEYEKDSSFMNTWVGDAIQKLNAGGADLGAGIFGVLDKAAKGLESATGGLIPRGGAFKDISDIFKADAEFSRARSNRYNGKDFTDLWKEGNYMGAIGDIALQGVESLPMSIGAMAATMAGAPAAGLAGIGSIVASQKYDDLDQNNPNMGEFAKVSNAILTGTAESLSEMLGAGVSKAWMSTLFKTLGKEKAQEAIKRGIMGKMQEFYKKFGMFFEPVNEGIEEVSSTLAENITDKITGADPERDLTDGVLQSFVYGMGGGAYFTGAGALAKGAQYVADKIGGKQAQQPITDSNVTDQGVDTPPLLTKSRFAEAEEEGRNMTDPGDIRTASKKMEETRLSLSGMVPGLASTIESYVDDKASEAQVMSLLDGVNADARPLAEDFYADYLRISGLQDRIGEEIDNEVETYVANNITPYVTTNPDGQSIVTTATLSEGNEERPVYVRSIEGDKAVISDNGQDRMVSVKRLSDIVEQDAGHMRRTYEDQLLATRQSELDMTMHHNPKTQLPKPGLIIWNGDNAFILQGQDENGDWIAQPAAYDRETGQVTAKNGSSPAMPITENEILDLQDAIYDAQQVNVVSPEDDNVESTDAEITSAPPMEDAINQPTSEIETEGAIDQIAQPSNVENPSMVMREDGTPDFVSSGTDMTLDFLHDKYGDKMPRKIEVTRKSFDESLKKASDALEKAQEAYDDAPIGKEDKAEAALIKARQEYEAIKVEADFWANLDDDIKEASKKPGDVIAKEISVMGDPMSGEELAAMMLANGAIKLTRDSYKKETGAGNNETARMFGLFASPEKGGVNIERAGEILELADRENGTNFFDENDTNAGRDAIIEVLSSAHTRGDLIDYVKRNREAIAERERQAEYNAYAEWCEENYHMSPEEYEAYEESMVRDFSEKQLTDEERGELDSQIVDEIQAIIDEQNEIDAILAQNKPIENENIEGNDESGGDGLREGGGEVLPREQLDQTGGTGEVEGRESAGPDIDRTDGATQEGSSRGLVPFVAPSPKENETPLDYAERIVEAKRLHEEELKVDTNPTEAQKEAGNYKKGHIKINGFDVTIEQPAGSVRSGKDANGKEWSVTMNNTYGYIRGTESVDGDHIDVFLGPDMNSDMVYVVDQVNTDGSFDEHKVMMGFPSLEDARSAYFSNYEDGWQGLGNITGVALDEFKKWIDSSTRKTKPFYEYKGIKQEEGDISKNNDSDNYSIVPSQYTTKKGKVLDMRLLKFGNELSKEQQRAAKELAKAEKGWYDREQRGFMMRSDESARRLADTILGDTDAVSDAQPISLEDTRRVVEPQKVNVENLIGDINDKGKAKLSDRTVTPSGNRLVTDERYAELRERMRRKLGGQMNMGVDPEILAIGTEMAVYHIEKGLRKFSDYSKAMIDDLGDAIRPYLKAFYNGARDLPEVGDNGWDKDMTAYEDVRSFDVANFDKPVPDIMDAAETVVRETEIARQASAAKKKIKNSRKKQTDNKDKPLPLYGNDLFTPNNIKDNEQGNLMDVAEDIVMRNRLSLNNINLNENGSIARDIEPEKGKQPSETKGTGRELETIDGVDENGNESERDHIDKPRGVENAIDGTENATDRNGKKTDGQVDNDGDQLDGGDTGDRNGSVRDGIDGERTVIGRAGSENKGRGVGESVREKTDDFSFAEKTIRFRENARNESVLFADNDIQVVEKQVGSAKDQYERTLSTSSYQFQEAFQDSMLGLKTLQDAVAKATRSRILDYENAYMAENALSSVNEAEFNAYRKAAFEPILKAMSRLEKMGSSIDEIRDYLITKHGIERNREMAVKRALSQNSETYKSLLDEYIGRRNEIRENGRSWEEQQSEMDRLAEEYGANLSDDFSGFTSMYPNEDNTGYDPDSARRYVLDYESRYDTSELSASVKRATDAILAKQRDSGLMSQNTFESISDMYQFYVPLRGWEETTADEVYAYLTSESQTFNAPIKTVVGRKSKADDPIATIANMAESGIMQGNRNLMKQKFLTMVQNHKTDLVSVSEMWVRLDEASGEWIAVFPDIPSNANPEQVESIVESFNKRMEELSNEKGSNVRRSRDAIGIPYKILPKDLKEHQVIVKRAGKEYVLTINGNPRAAQALNGLTNPDNTKGWFGTVERYAGWLNRNLAANFTTRNPNFMVSNFLRDALYSNTTVWVKESPVYAWKFNKNFAMVNPINMYRLVKGYENGTLDMSDPLNKAYHDFVMRGGETGYTNLRDVEAKKKAIQKELRYSKQKVSIGKALKILGEWMDLFNKSVENCARFAAFITSREMGRSMDKSIYDAKEISVNFNKKGAGSKFLNTEGQTKIGNASAFTSGLSRSMYVFWNAGVQGMYNFGRLAKDNPKKFLGLASSFYLLGTIMPMLAAAFGDDEDDDYYDLPEYVRRNNICFRNGGGNWITIPMPIELRAIYGLGEMSSGIVSGKEKYTDKKMAMKIAEQMSQVLPLDMMEGGGGFSAFVPSSVKPLIEAGDNKDWTGLPLYKDNDFNKGMPEWTKAFKSVDPAILAMTKYANELTGGDKYTTGTVNLNPAIIEHILDGYFGGIEATRSQMVKSAETAWGSRDFDWRNIPVGNRLIKSGDERTRKKAIDNAYYENLEEMEKIGQRLRGYRKELSNPQNDSFDMAEYQKKLNDLMMSDEYRRYIEFNNLNKLYQSMGEYLKKVDDERLEMELYDLKAMMNEIANGK